MTLLQSFERPSRVSALFEHALSEGDAISFCLPGGVPLFRAGETADHLYLLRTGRLVVKHEDGAGSGALIHPGEPVGEMALIAGRPHEADVLALRDCELLAITQTVFLSAVEGDAALGLELSRLLLARTRSTPPPATTRQARAFGLIATSGDIEARALAEDFGAAIRRLGHTVAVANAESSGDTPEWFADLEGAHDFVLYAAEWDEGDWAARMERQIDGLFRVANGEQAPALVRASTALLSRIPVDLILVHEPDRRAPADSEAWVRALGPDRVFQLRRGHAPDVARLARMMTGQAVALVLSGGAARAYAHVGVVRALHEADVPIDLIGGTSMGGVIGAGVAMGWDDAELDWRLRKAFVESSPVDDIAFPMIAMTHGDKVRDRLAEHFGDRTIDDLWLPFFCVSSNLTTGTVQLHRDGPVRDALRASLSLPGVLPPVIVGSDVLVDGAVLNNYPADIMRSMHDGPIVGVDVGRGRSIEARDVHRPKSIIRWLLSGDWRNGPPIVSVLMRAATVTAAREISAAHLATDVLVQPNVDDIEIRDWKAYAPAVAEGRRATLSALAAFHMPITEVRRQSPPAA